MMVLNCGVGEDSWESLGLQGDPTSPFWRRSALGFLWREWCWSWNSSTLATSCEELTHWKRLWCWQGLEAGGKGDDRGWDGWMVSPTQWTWVWINSGSCWWTGRPGVLQSVGSQSWTWLIDWTEMNWDRGLEVITGPPLAQYRMRGWKASDPTSLWGGKKLDVVFNDPSFLRAFWGTSFHLTCCGILDAWGLQKNKESGLDKHEDWRGP